MIALDGKFSGVIVRNSNGEVIPPDQFVVFLARDNALPATLVFYMQECNRIGSGEEQIDAVERLYYRVLEWRKNNPDKLKIPDAEPREPIRNMEVLNNQEQDLQAAGWTTIRYANGASVLWYPPHCMTGYSLDHAWQLFLLGYCCEVPLVRGVTGSSEGPVVNADAAHAATMHNVRIEIGH